MGRMQDFFGLCQFRSKRFDLRHEILFNRKKSQRKPNKHIKEENTNEKHTIKVTKKSRSTSLHLQIGYTCTRLSSLVNLDTFEV